MGDSGGACLMHPFSYASGLNHHHHQRPLNQGNQNANPMDGLGDSISFGRFMSESLAWEKWSTFSHNRYVEEAERYAQPGFVAQKKAFFEAHYKRIAAAKKAAALLDQQPTNATTQLPQPQSAAVTTLSGPVMNNSDVSVVLQQAEAEVDDNDDVQGNSDEKSVEQVTSQVGGTDLVHAPVETPVKKDLPNPAENMDNQDRTSGFDLGGTPQMEKPLLKSSSSSHEAPSVTSKKKSALSSLKSSVYRRTSKAPFTPANEPDKPFGPAIRIAPDKASKNCATPLKTPNMAASARMSKHELATPHTENTRTKTQNDGSKTTGPKWHILSAVCSKSLTACRNKLHSPTLSTPFILRTEERAARRRQKLEEKFNCKEVQKVQLQTKLKEKAESELRKLRQSFCFKARPLPDFYKDNREASKTKMNKRSTVQPHSNESSLHKLDEKANNSPHSLCGSKLVPYYFGL